MDDHIANPNSETGLRPDDFADRRNRAQQRPRAKFHNRRSFGALDLGTNNCRLLVACPAEDGFTVIDAFSRIVRLGEGLSTTGRLSDQAIDRSIAALEDRLDTYQRMRNRVAASFTDFASTLSAPVVRHQRHGHHARQRPSRIAQL